MSELDSAGIQGLKDKHGDVYELPLFGDVVVYFKPLGRAKNSEIQNVVEELRRKGASETEINDRAESLVLEGCLLSPDGEEFKKLLENRAGIGPTIVEQIYAISGFLIMDAPKKL